MTAQSQHEESILFSGMGFIEELNRIPVKENRLCLLEGDAMLVLIGRILGGSPFEPHISHIL